MEGLGAERYDARQVRRAYDHSLYATADISTPDWRETYREHAYSTGLSVATHDRVLAAQVRAGDRVLEIGPGWGPATRTLLDLGAHVITGDISAGVIARHRLHVGSPPGLLGRTQLDALALPFADNSFDALVSFGGPISCVMERGAEAWAEMVRVVRPGGMVALSVVPWGWLNAYPQYYASLGAVDREAVRQSGDITGTTIVHRLRCYTESGLRALLATQPCRVTDMLASYVEPPQGATPATLDWEAHMARCRQPGGADSTRGFLIACAEVTKPA